MNQSLKAIVRCAILVVPLLLASASVHAQEDAYEKAKQEIKQQMGTFPAMFKAFPKYALPGAWETFKALSGPESVIPPKYRELMQLSVASQIPCSYCIYFHTAAAKVFGATDEEIREAVAQGAQTRHWSMILQGNEIELEGFKKEVDSMFKYMSEQAEQ